MIRRNIKQVEKDREVLFLYRLVMEDTFNRMYLITDLHKMRDPVLFILRDHSRKRSMTRVFKNNKKAGIAGVE